MLSKKILRKMFATTMISFILLIAFSFTLVKENNLVSVNMDVKTLENISTNNIYLLNKNGYLVKTHILLEEDNLDKNLRKLLNNLKVNNMNTYSNGLRGTIPESVKILDVFCGKNFVTINFSKEFLDVDKYFQKRMLQSIVYSVMDLCKTDGINILVEGENFKKFNDSTEIYPSVLNKSIGINEVYEASKREDITSVVVYYLENIDENFYYVPVTRYVCDNREKINIIIDELTTSYIYEENLMSFLNSKTKLIDYHEENNALVLNFNEYFFDGSDKILEEVVYSIGYSVFDNYNVDMVMFEVNNKNVFNISRKSI